MKSNSTFQVLPGMLRNIECSCLSRIDLDPSAKPSTPPTSSHVSPLSIGIVSSPVHERLSQAFWWALSNRRRSAGEVSLGGPSCIPASASSILYCKLGLSAQFRNRLHTCEWLNISICTQQVNILRHFSACKESTYVCLIKDDVDQLDWQWVHTICQSRRNDGKWGANFR